VIPWKRVDLDMIGPYKVQATNGKFTLRVLTMIDPATGWFEVRMYPTTPLTVCKQPLMRYALANIHDLKSLGLMVVANSNTYSKRCIRIMV
jgi:hypothetical protein